jgi:hypothetical protein
MSRFHSTSQIQFYALYGKRDFESDVYLWQRGVFNPTEMMKSLT